MSGNSYRSYGASRELSDFEKFRNTERSDRAREEHARAEAERARRIAEDRKEVTKKSAKPREMRDSGQIYDRSLVQIEVKEPDAQAKRVHIVLIDNSGSNEKIAKHLKNSSGYLLSVLRAIDPDSRICFVYFSDHRDGVRMWQPVNYIPPTEEGDRILHSSIRHVEGANGHDAPEAIECALWDACDLPFGHVQERHLYLVTDVVAHGMGLHPDHGCPLDRNWRDSLKRVKECFSSFEVVGSGGDPDTGELQKKFIIDPSRLALDLIDLSSIPTHEHRCGIVGNAILFLIARHQGNQCVEAFLMTLYEKWLNDPIFGANTDMAAREAIRRFGKYIEAPDDWTQKMLKKVFC